MTQLKTMCLSTLRSTVQFSQKVCQVLYNQSRCCIDKKHVSVIKINTVIHPSTRYAMHRRSTGTVPYRRHYNHVTCHRHPPRKKWPAAHLARRHRQSHFRCMQQPSPHSGSEQNRGRQMTPVIVIGFQDQVSRSGRSGIRGNELNPKP